MRKAYGWTPIYIIVLLIAAGLIASAARDGRPAAHATTSAETVSALRDSVPDLAGTWTGLWRDVIYMGEFEWYSMTWTITQDGDSLSAVGTIDMSYFGMGDMQGTGSGTLSGSGRQQSLSFSFECTGLGSGSGGVVIDAALGTGTVGSPLNFGAFTFGGTVTGETIDGTFDFLSPSGGEGVGTMTKDTPVEPASWGEIKSRFSDGE